MDCQKWEDLDKKESEETLIKESSKSAKEVKEQVKLKYLEVSFVESLVYFICLWSGVIYSLYKFYLKSQKWKRTLYLTLKESSFGNYQDQNDSEWNIFLPVIYEILPYYILHLIVSQLIKCYKPQVLCLFYITFSSFMLIKIIGVYGLAVCILVPTIMFVVLHSRSKTLLWLTWCSFLIAFNTQIFYNYLSYFLSDVLEGEYKTSVIVAWIILRSLSFCLDTCDEDPFRTKSSSSLLINILAYCLYFPLILTGPYMPCIDFQAGISKPFIPWNLKKFVWFCLQSARFMFWLYVTDVTLYFFYAHSLTYSSSKVRSLDSWTLAGYVYYMMAFFIMKYVVYYGISGYFAKAEGYQPPEPPKCVLIVHRFSDVWRYFDHGLYRFMIKHIYIPFVGGEHSLIRSIQGSVVVFTFIYVWHGVSSSVLWWSLINFTGITIEKIGDMLTKNPSYIRWSNCYLPGVWSRRLKCALYSGLLVMSVNSLLIFMSTVENAKAMLEKIFISGFPITTFTLLFMFYCVSNISMDMQNYKQRRKLHRE